MSRFRELSGAKWREVALVALTLLQVHWVLKLIDTFNLAGFLSLLILVPFTVWAWSIKVSNSLKPATVAETAAEGLGQLAHDVYVASHGHGGEWNDLPLNDQIAWCVAARAVANHIREVDRLPTKEP